MAVQYPALRFELLPHMFQLDSVCPWGFPTATPFPTTDMRVMLIGESKFSVSVNVSLSLYVNHMMNWQPVLAAPHVHLSAGTGSITPTTRLAIWGDR